MILFDCMNMQQKRIVKYYTDFESRFGYDFFLWGSKHFGFYPTGKQDISEKEAQLLLQDLVAQNLDLKKAQIVLDAGCGQGVVSTYLAKKSGVRIHGITVVPFEVQRAQKLAASYGVQEHTHYQVMDYSATSFPDNYFDAIYTTETLSHSPDIHKTLKEFSRILKPGGKFAFFEYTLAPESAFSSWEKKMLEIVIEGSAMMGLKDFRHNQFTSVLNNAGFENVREQNISEQIRPSFYRLHKWARVPYQIIRFFRLQRYFINTTAGYEYYKMASKGLIRYCIFTGNKSINKTH